ncbi:MAG: hypothetical protein R2772_04725 [Chitinophagales bacterium]
MKRIFVVACSLVLSLTVFSQPNAKKMFDAFMLVEEGGFARAMEFEYSMQRVKEIEAKRVNIEMLLEEVESKFDAATRYTLNFDLGENYARLQYYFKENKLEAMAVLFYADEDAKIIELFNLLSKYYLKKDKSFWLVEEKADYHHIQGKYSRYLLQVKLNIQEDEYGKFLHMELQNITPY